MLRTRCEGPAETDLFDPDTLPALAGAAVQLPALFTNRTLQMRFGDRTVSNTASGYALRMDGTLAVSFVPTGPVRVVLDQTSAP